jgi:hypothetical protein
VFNKRKQEYQFIHACNGGEYCSPIFDSKLAADELICATEFLNKSVSHPVVFADVVNFDLEISGGVNHLYIKHITDT